MAKISARGAHELERHTRPDGVEYLLRTDGVVLKKYTKGTSWKRAFRLGSTDKATASAPHVWPDLTRLFREVMARRDAEVRAGRVTAHTCPHYTNARGEEINPAVQGGIGCPVCYPPDGRYRA
jgi:hypothetical protein